VRTTRLYIEDTILPTGAVINLAPDASKYLSKVMRYASGDTVVLFNGDGNNYIATIIDIGKSVQVKINSVEKNSTESPLSITLVQSLAKGTKLDLIIQKATELGATRISPVSTERTVLQIDKKRADKKSEHWNKIAQSACAQCNRSVVPVIDSVVSLKQWCEDHKNENSVLIHPKAKLKFSELQSNTAINILVGPEGGFSDAELAMAVESGAQTVQCGPRVMRTETAGLVAIAIVQSMIGDLG